MLLTHLLNTLICGQLVIDHILVPCACKFFELSPLKPFQLDQFLTLPFFHAINNLLTFVNLEFFELLLGSLGLDVIQLLFALSKVVHDKPFKSQLDQGAYFKILSVVCPGIECTFCGNIAPNSFTYFCCCISKYILISGLIRVRFD